MPALREAAIALRFAGGIESKMDSKAVPTTKLLTLENAVFTKAISLVKRNGYEDLNLAVDGSSSKMPAARRLGRRGDDELLAFTGTRCYSHQPALDLWADAGPAFSVVATDRSAVRTGTQQTMPDHATNRGVRVDAWEDSRGGVWWTAVDSSSGRVLRVPEQLDGGGQQPRCVPVGDVLHIYWANVAQRSIYVAVCNPQTPSAAIATSVLIDDLNPANPSFDAEATTYAGSPSVIAWAELGTTNFRVAFVHPGGVIGSPVTSLPLAFRESSYDVTGAISISAERPNNCTKLEVTVVCAGAIITAIYSLVGIGGPLVDLELADDFSQPTVGTPARVTSVLMDDGDVWIAWEITDAAPSQHHVHIARVFGDPVSQVQRSVCLVARAFQIAGDAFVTVAHDTTYFNTYLTLRLSDLFPIGRHSPGGASGAPTRVHLSSAQIDYVNAPDVVAMCLPHRDRLISENNDKFTETGLRFHELDFDSEDVTHELAQLGAGVYMAGACPLHYDGRLWTEMGFHVGPELIVAVPGAGGAMTSAVEYEYLTWYEWTDAQGEVHRGPTSIGTTVTMGGGDTQVTLTLPTLRITQKQNVRICVARSLGNDNSQGFLRVSSLDPNISGPNGYIANDPTVDTVTFVDRMDDATLRAQEPLYTNGGILSNDPSQLGSAIAGGKGRLFFTDPSDPLLVRFSQPLDDGYGAEVPPDLSLRCDPYGGDVTALAAMDSTIVAFKSDTLFGFDGDGPLPNGDTSQAGFSTPQLIPSTAGCTDPASIVLTPAGLMFKGKQGIMQCDRSRTVTYIGAPVEAFNGQKVRRATPLPDRPAVIFLTDSGKTLYYDYFFGQWSTFTNHEGLDAVVVGGRYHYLRTDGRIFRETIGEYSDAGKAIKLRIETAWIKLHEHLQGWSHFWFMHLIGERKSPHQLAVQMRVAESDAGYNAKWCDPAYLDATGATDNTGWITGDRARPIGEEPMDGTVYGEGPYGEGPYGGVAPGNYQWRAHLGIKGQAIQFRFEDYERTGQPGPSFELSELVLTGGVIGNARRPFSAARST